MNVSPVKAFAPKQPVKAATTVQFQGVSISYGFPDEPSPANPPQFQGGSDGFSSTNKPVPKPGRQEDLTLFQRQLNADVDAAERADFKAKMLTKDLGQTCLKIGPREFNQYEVLSLIKGHMQSVNSTDFCTLFKAMFPEKARNVDNSRLYIRATAALKSQGLLEYSDYEGYTNDLFPFSYPSTIRISHNGNRVLDELTLPEIKEAFVSRSAQRAEELKAQEAKAEQTKAQQAEAAKASALQRAEKEAAEKKSAFQKETRRNRTLIYKHASGMTGWDLLRRYVEMTETRSLRTFYFKRGPVSEAVFLGSFPQSNQANVKELLKELQSVGILTKGGYHFGEHLGYGASAPLTIPLKREQFQHEDPVTALNLTPTHLKSIVEMDIEGIEAAINARQVQLDQQDLEFQQALIRLSETQTRYETTKAKAIELFDTAQNEKDLATKSKSELEAAKLVQAAETLKMNVDAETQGTETIRLYLQDVKARYSMWHAEMQQHIQRRRQMIFQMQTAALVNDMSSLLKSLSQMEADEAQSQRGLATSLATVYGDVQSNKTALDANRVLLEANAEMRKVDLADRIKALKAGNTQPSDATEASKTTVTTLQDQVNAALARELHAEDAPQTGQVRKNQS